MLPQGQKRQVLRCVSRKEEVTTRRFNNPDTSVWVSGFPRQHCLLLSSERQVDEKKKRLNAFADANNTKNFEQLWRVHPLSRRAVPGDCFSHSMSCFAEYRRVLTPARRYRRSQRRDSALGRQREASRHTSRPTFFQVRHAPRASRQDAHCCNPFGRESQRAWSARPLAAGGKVSIDLSMVLPHETF